MRTLLATILLLASSAFATPGALDTTFGTGGTVFTNIAGGGGQFNGVAIQADGKVVATGVRTDGGNSDVLVVRYTAAGNLDATFGTGGMVVTPAPDLLFSKGNAIIVQPNGQIVVATTSSVTFTLIRYNADGSLDVNFGTVGFASLQIGDFGETLALARQADGKLVAAGYAVNSITAAAEFAVARFNVDGTFDPNFGCATPGTCAGYATTGFGGIYDQGNAIAIQGDNRIVVAGSAATATGADYALARYNPDGTLDTFFGTGGKVTTALGATTNFNASSGVAVQGDGKIVLAGIVSPTTSSHMVAIRYAANGALDATFGSGGVREVTQAGDGSAAFGVVLQPDGKIVLAGYGDNGVIFGITLVRLNTDGSLDAGFGTAGVAIGAESYTARALARQADGRFVACGDSFAGIPELLPIERFNANGSVDASFNSTGVVLLAIGTSSDVVNSLAIQPDGRILAMGSATAFQSSTGALVRYLANGSLDPSFAGTGIVLNGGSSSRIALQDDGKILLAYGGTTFHIRRLNTDGSLDASFNGTGTVSIPIGLSSHAVNGIAIQPDGRIVLAGSASNGTNADFALARFNANGTLDTSFNGTGKVFMPIGAGADSASAVAILSSGKILVAGTSLQPGTNNDFVLARYNADGSLDATYIDAVLGAGTDVAFALAVQADGKILVGGRSAGKTAVIRVNANFTPDTGFGTAGAFVIPNLEVRGIALQADGRIVLATVGAVVLRLNADGTLDSTFGNAGSVTLVPGGVRNLFALALQSDAQIVVAGSSTSADFALARIDWSSKPHAFAFPSQTGVARSATIVSAPVQITGIAAANTITVANGEYCVSSGFSCACDVRAFGTVASTVANGQSVCVRHTSASGFGQSVTTTLTVDTVSGTFTSTTLQVALIAISAPLPFGSQAVGTTGVTQAISISNIGNLPAGNVLVLAEGGDFLVVGTTCGTSLAQGASCSASVAFTPVQAGARAGELVVLAPDSTEPRTSVTLTGSGTAQASLVPTLGTSAATTTYGTTVTFTATVATATTGIVFFHDGGNFIGAGTLTGTTAKFATRFLAAGTHPITAEFVGNDTFTAGVSAPLTQTVNGAGSTTLVQASANPVMLGDAITFKSNVTGPGAQFAGTVAFLRGGVALAGCAAVPLVNGSASCSAASLPLGSNSIVAQYAGDGNNLPSVSPTLVEQVNYDPLADADNDGIPNGVEVTEGRNQLLKDNDVFGNARLFTMQQYRDFLSREGDAAGIQGWVDLLNAGTYNRLQVIDAFLSSIEFSGSVAPVVRLYFATFLRVPDYAGLTFNAGLVRNGTTTLVQLADFFTQSPEFMATYGALNDTQFVTLLYNNVLGRAPDTAGLNGWLALLASGNTRGQVLVGFSDSPEYQANTANEVFVTMMYTGMLRRTPEAGGFNGWVSGMDSGTYTRTQVVNGFFLSIEYHNRFLP
jgi:uncharacterized delta-60 repeat protein